MSGRSGLREVIHADDFRPRFDSEVAQLALQAPQLLRVVLGLESQRQQLGLVRSVPRPLPMGPGARSDGGCQPVQNPVQWYLNGDSL